VESKMEDLITIEELEDKVAPHVFEGVVLLD
jgi:hypothetical protein